MKNLFGNWGRLKEDLSVKCLVLFLDYDGTLTPIVDTPKKAVIPSQTKRILNKLKKCLRCRLAIISGRSLKDIKKIVGIKGITYVGNHGLEIEGPKIRFKDISSLKSKALLKQIRDDLNKKLSAINGAFVEDKRLTLSIHYRLVDKKNVSKVKGIFYKTIQPYLIRKKVRVKPGKKVFEIRPPVEWDKGKVALWLLARQQFASKGNKIFPIYIGDDVTDEDAFRALKNKGLTIFVGKDKNSHAKYYLRNPKQVRDFLRRILNLPR